RQAVRRQGTVRAPAGVAEADDRRRRGSADVRGRRAEHADPRGRARRRPDRADADGVRAARALHGAAQQGALARRDLRDRVRLRHELRLELARGVRRLPPPEARGQWAPAADPHGSRPRLHPSRGMSLRLRLVLATGAAVSLAVFAALLTAYYIDRSKLR